MFCSSCKSIEPVRDCKRKICPTGHVICERCDGSDFEKCPKCNLPIKSQICLQVEHEVPRLSITKLNGPQPYVLPENMFLQEENLLSDSESFQEMLDQIKEYDEREMLLKDTDSYNEAIKPIFGLFQIISHHSDSGHKQSSHRTSTPVHHRAAQTSMTGCVEPGIIGDANFESKALNRTFTLDDSSAESASVYELYHNSKQAEESEFAHYTSLSIPVMDPSPPPSLPDTANSASLAHRVKFVEHFEDDVSIPAQMEPIMHYLPDDDESMFNEIPSDKLKILPRFPIFCPINVCNKCLLPSDFCNHITIDHPYIEVKRVAPEVLMNLSISSKINLNVSSCQKFFLVTDAITDIGFGRFANCLPVALVTTKLSLRRVHDCPVASSANGLDPQDFYIWLASVYMFPLNYTMTVWRHGKTREMAFIKTITTTVGFMNLPFNPKRIASNALSLTEGEMRKLTNNGRSMISCQIVFH